MAEDHAGNTWYRRSMVSALTMLELDEMHARYASYQDLAETIRIRFTAVPETLSELFSRLCFNVLVGIPTIMPEIMPPFGTELRFHSCPPTNR
jgi:hypothetical protein